MPNNHAIQDSLLTVDYISIGLILPEEVNAIIEVPIGVEPKVRERSALP